MLENNRDEINFHKFLKSVRKSQGVSMEKVALGVCTKSEMSRIEKGTRLPEKLVRDRLTARLGISGEEYEEYLLPKEYEHWKCRMEIIRCINKKDVAGTEEKLAAYKDTYHGSKVDTQFVEAMKFMLLEMKGVSEDELFEQVCVALKCTVLDMDVALDGAHLLADQELNLIMEYIRLRKAVIPERNLAEWKLERYNKILNYLENSKLDRLAQSKIYAKAASYISELVLKEFLTEDGLSHALNICTCAIELLRDMLRLYYFVELNEYRMKLIDHLRTYRDVEKSELEQIYHQSKEWNALICELYVENNVPIYMENFAYLYAETECNNVTDVLRIRRAMMGLPRRKMVGYACEERTLARIEKENQNPSMTTVRELFDRMGICAEYKRARIVTSDADTLHLSKELMLLMNNYKHDEAMAVIEKLYGCTDMDIPYNEQELKRQELMINRRIRRISNEEHIERLTDILECTLSIDSLMSGGEKYLTRTELACLHDFATHTVGTEQIKSRGILENMCLQALDIEFDVSKLYLLELHMNRIACIYGDEGKYEMSNKISNKLLKESLRNRRMNVLTGCIYNNLWNQQQMIQNIDKNTIIHMLNKSYLLACIAKEDSWKGFFQQKINETR